MPISINEANEFLLQRRVRDRAALMQRLTQKLEQNAEMVACWLFGSLGRGEADALSDLDVWTIMPDAQIAQAVMQRREMAAGYGHLLLLVEGPQNAPADGAYLMALYDAPTGPLQVDWYWQKQSQARIPPQTQVLFDRAGLPRDDRPLKLDYNPNPEPYPDPSLPFEQQARLRAENSVAFFWAMLCITAKYAARSPWEEHMGLLQYVHAPLREAMAFLKLPSEAENGEETTHATPETKMSQLHDLAAKMEALHPALVSAGVYIPPALTASVYRYLALIQTIVLSLPRP